MPFLLDPTSLVMFPMQRRHPNITIVGQMMYREILTLSKETTSAMVGVIDGFRWCLLGGQSQLYWPGLALSVAVAAFFLWFGIRQFRKMEKSFADLI